MSRAKNAKRTYNATLCLSSSPHFFYGIVFCFVLWVQLFVFFCLSKKTKYCKCAGCKNYDRKKWGQQRMMPRLLLRGIAVLCAGGCFCIIQTDDVLPTGLSMYLFAAWHIVLYCQCIYVRPCIAPVVCCIVLTSKE